MPLKLVTGPANAGKAGLLLEELRVRLDDEPILVVPTFRDVESYRRELASAGAVFGPEVMRFAWLVREVARRVGWSPSVLGGTQARLAAAAAVRRAPLRRLAGAARTRGFAPAFRGLVAELERELVEPAELQRALGSWAGADSSRREYTRELAGLWDAYRAVLGELRRVDPELYAAGTLARLREEPERWGRTPLFVYGFDDFTGVELGLLKALSQDAGADVTVALTWEDGRAALRSRGRAMKALGAEAVAHEVLPARSEHYAEDAREPLHQLERCLWEDSAGVVPSGGAVRRLEAGGERAEVELVGAEVRRAIAEHQVDPEQLAVVFRSPAAYVGLVQQVFSSYGLPFSLDCRIPLGHTALGRGFLGLARCALGAAPASDLLAYLRTPGVVERPGLVDALEDQVRRRDVTDAGGACALWEAERWPLDAIRRVTEARARGIAALLEALARELERLFVGPYERRAARLASDELVDVQAQRAARDALRGLGDLAADASFEPGPTEVLETLEDVEVRVSSPALAGAVQVLDPFALRARRVRMIFVCGLQEGEFPRPGRADPFLPDDVRRRLLSAGVVLREREETLDDERALFYSCASRAEERLVLSYRTSDEEGVPAVRSFFVDDVLDLFERVPVEARPLSDVTWKPEKAPTARERRRALAAAPPGREPPVLGALRSEAVLTAIRERAAWSAGAVENYAGCPAQWFVDNLLRPATLEPMPEPMARGTVAHAVLERTLNALREATGSAQVTQLTLRKAQELLRAELARLEPDLPLSTRPARRRSGFRRLEADLLRYLRRAAATGGGLEPSHFEWSFGDEEGEPRALELDGLRVRGKVDRIDTEPGGTRAIVYDYKGSKGYPVARWVPDRRLQVALYMLAVRDLLELEPMGGLYQPLAGEQRARGLILDGFGPAPHAVDRDRRDADGLAAELEELRQLALAAGAGMRSGELQPTPATCGYKGECTFPEICRCESR